MRFRRWQKRRVVKITSKKEGEFTVDGFTFNLQKDNNRIYVFKGDAFVRAYIYPTYEEAKKDFDEAKTKKRVIFK